MDFPKSFLRGSMEESVSETSLDKRGLGTKQGKLEGKDGEIKDREKVAWGGLVTPRKIIPSRAPL